MLTEEEKKQRRMESQKKYRNSEKGKEKRKSYAKEYNKKYREEHIEEHNKRSHEYYYKNRDLILEKRKKHYEENKDVILERNKKWQSEHPECMSAYREKNKEKFSEYNKLYSKTPMGRACNLYGSYVVNDRKHERIGKELPINYITPKWIVENVFSGQKCHYCEESDWTKLGCDRIDNDKPHTIDNVVPCCLSCNSKKGSMSYEEFMKMLGEKNS